jgi:hypothetical protein
MYLERLTNPSPFEHLSAPIVSSLGLDFGNDPYGMLRPNRTIEACAWEPILPSAADYEAPKH